MKKFRTPRRARGVMLIEALVAILIFSVGILAVVGMQSVAIRNVTDAKLRSDAAFLAGELLSQMWADTPNLASYAYAGSGTPPSRIDGWVTRVAQRLPGTTGTGSVPPIVVVTADATLGTIVQITVRWRLPEEASTGAAPHRHMVLATVNVNP